MLELLEKLCKEQKYISLYVNANDLESFKYGRILAVNQFFTLIEQISTAGEFDGIILKKTEKIIRIELDSNYNKKMEILMKDNNDDNSFINSININRNIDLRVFLLKYAQDHNEIISVELADSEYYDIVGNVDKIESSFCSFLQIDDYGNRDGISCVKVDDISSISCGSEFERILNSLQSRLNNKTHNTDQLG